MNDTIMMKDFSPPTNIGVLVGDLMLSTLRFDETTDQYTLYWSEKANVNDKTGTLLLRI